MPERSAWKEGPNVFALAWITLLLANYFGTFADLDFAWQIRTGEQIIRHATLRPPDAFTYTIAGQHIPDFLEPPAMPKQYAGQVIGHRFSAL